MLSNERACHVLTALGVDCGGSATRWQLIAEDGREIANGQAAGATGHVYEAGARDHTRHVIRTICAEIVGRDAPPRSVTAGITGLTNESAAAATIRDWLAADLSLAAAQIAVVDDMWIAFHTVFEPGTGIVVYSGTGSVACHIDQAGELRKSGAHGHIIDDGGSGYWIGREGLVWLMRVRDEQGAPPATPLATRLGEEIGGMDWERIRPFVYSEPRTQVAKLGRCVADAAGAGDEVARRILTRAGAELARLANVLARRLPVQPVALIGGSARLHGAIAESFAAQLDRQKIARMADGAPDLRTPIRTPVAAAARLALAQAQTTA